MLEWCRMDDSTFQDTEDKANDNNFAHQPSIITEWLPGELNAIKELHSVKQIIFSFFWDTLH